MTITLKPHQSKVVKYMKQSGQRGIILFHGLGSGKTITSIALAESFGKNVVVVVPASMRTQWDEELGNMKVDKKKYKVMSYEGFLKDSSKIPSIKDKVIIVDEAHRIRTSTGKIASTAVKVLQQAHKVILLTGTPMVNSPVDMSPLVNAVEGTNVLPVDDKQFNDKFYMTSSMKSVSTGNLCKQHSLACSQSGKKHKMEMCKYHYVMWAIGRQSPPGTSKSLKKDDLDGKSSVADWKVYSKKRIQDTRSVAKLVELKPDTAEYAKYVKHVVSYYKPKQSIQDFPKVKTQIIKVPMSETQNKHYVAAQKKVNSSDMELLTKGVEVTRKTASFNAFLNATRQISNTYKGETNTPKLNKVIEFLKKNPKPAIVYSNWIENGIEPLAKMLDAEKISSLKFTGGMTDAKKQTVVENYNDGQIDVLLLSSSGGEGLDLKKTRQIHILEPHWNDAKISQVIGRGIRYKSHEDLPVDKRKVTVVHWISTPLSKVVGTDEYLYQLSEKKLNEMKAFQDTAIKLSIEGGKGLKSVKGGTRKKNKKRGGTRKKYDSNDLTMLRIQFM